MFQDIDENLLKFIPDYHINLVEPSAITEFDKFQTELGQTLEFIKYSKDDVKLEEMLNHPNGQSMSNATISTINLFTGANIKINEKGEVTNVCLAIEIMKQKAVAREFLNNVDNAMTAFNVSLEKACEGLGHTIEEYNKAQELLEQAKRDEEKIATSA